MCDHGFQFPSSSRRIGPVALLACLAFAVGCQTTEGDPAVMCPDGLSFCASGRVCSRNTGASSSCTTDVCCFEPNPGCESQTTCDGCVLELGCGWCGGPGGYCADTNWYCGSPWTWDRCVAGGAPETPTTSGGGPLSSVTIPACLGSRCPTTMGPYGAIPGTCCSGARCVSATNGCATEQPDCTPTNRVCIAEAGAGCSSTSDCTGAGYGGGLSGEGAWSGLSGYECREGRCCKLAPDGSCTVANGYACGTNADCISGFCHEGMCALYSECLAHPCSASCCDESAGFVCADDHCAWGGASGAVSTGSGPCVATCPSTCDLGVPHQACLYCQSVCVFDYALAHLADCCLPGMEATCQSQLEAGRASAMAMAVSLGTSSCP